MASAWFVVLRGFRHFVDVAAEMVHGFVGLCGAFPEATEAMQRAAHWVKQRVK